MQTKFIEATDESEFNWGKFAVCRFNPEEWSRNSAMSPGRGLLALVGQSFGDVLVLDLHTCEGAIFSPGGFARADLDKHQVWVCPMYAPFLEWLYKQDLSDLEKLPAMVNLGAVPTALRGYRRKGNNPACGHPVKDVEAGSCGVRGWSMNFRWSRR